MANNQYTTESGLLLVIPVESLLPNNVVQFTIETLKSLESQFDFLNQSDIKIRVNGLFQVIFSQGYNAKLSSILNLMSCDFLIKYSQHYNSLETVNNVLDRLKQKDIKIFASNKYAYAYKFTLAFAYFVRFNVKLRDNEENYLTKTDLTDILASKFYSRKIYIQHLEGKNTITGVNLENTLLFLNTALSQLGRWPEIISYISRIYPDLKPVHKFAI